MANRFAALESGSEDDAARRDGSPVPVEGKKKRRRREAAEAAAASKEAAATAAAEAAAEAASEAASRPKKRRRKQKASHEQTSPLGDNLEEDVGPVGGSEASEPLQDVLAKVSSLQVKKKMLLAELVNVNRELEHEEAEANALRTGKQVDSQLDSNASATAAGGVAARAVAIARNSPRLTFSAAPAAGRAACGAASARSSPRLTFAAAPASGIAACAVAIARSSPRLTFSAAPTASDGAGASKPPPGAGSGGASDAVAVGAPRKILLPGGLTCEVTREAPETAKVAKPGMVVMLRFEGRLNGKRNDRRFDAGMLDFILGDGSMIPGFNNGVAGMRVGEQRRIWVPAKMGYGKKGKKSKVPPNSDLVFDVVLQKAGCDVEESWAPDNPSAVSKKRRAKMKQQRKKNRTP